MVVNFYCTLYRSIYSTKNSRTKKVNIYLSLKSISLTRVLTNRIFFLQFSEILGRTWSKNVDFSTLPLLVRPGWGLGEWPRWYILRSIHRGMLLRTKKSNIFLVFRFPKKLNVNGKNYLIADWWSVGQYWSRNAIRAPNAKKKVQNVAQCY